MTPYHQLAVPVICGVVLATFVWLALRALIVASWRTPPGRPVPSDTRPTRGRRGT